VRNRSEETNHHRIQHHAVAEFFGQAGRRVAVTLRLAWQVGNTHQALFDDQSAALLSVPEQSA